MEYLEGQIADRPRPRHASLDLPTAQRIGAQIADALAAAHGLGVIHRDLKPDNIYVIKRQGNPDYVKILDFWPRQAALASGRDQPQDLVGIGAGHAAPWRPSGARDAATSTVALTCIRWAASCSPMVCGRLPFPGDGFAEVILKHISEPPPVNPRSLNPAVTPAFEKLVLHCLAKNRDFRFQKAEDVAAALRDPEVVAGIRQRSRPPSPARPVRDAG